MKYELYSRFVIFLVGIDSFDTILDILSLLATFGGALIGAFIAGHFTLKAVKKDNENRLETARKEKEEKDNNKIKQIKTRLLFEIDNLMIFNNEVAKNLFSKDFERLQFKNNLVLYSPDNKKLNLTFYEMEKLRYLVIANKLSNFDKKENILEKFSDKEEKGKVINLSKDKIEVVYKFLSNTDKKGESCFKINKSSIIRLEDFYENLKDLSHLIYILDREELNILYLAKQVIKLIIENSTKIDSSDDYHYTLDINYFTYNILISEINYICKDIV